MADKLSYSEQLKHPLWQKRSAEVKARAGWKCEECARDYRQLSAHHVHYLLGKMLWEYPDALLICVCDECHKERQLLEQQILTNVATVLRDLKVAELKVQPAFTFFTEEVSERR